MFLISHKKFFIPLSYIILLFMIFSINQIFKKLFNIFLTGDVTPPPVVLLPTAPYIFPFGDTFLCGLCTCGDTPPCDPAPNRLNTPPVIPLLLKFGESVCNDISGSALMSLHILKLFFLLSG